MDDSNFHEYTMITISNIVYDDSSSNNATRSDDSHCQDFTGFVASYCHMRTVDCGSEDIISGLQRFVRAQSSQKSWSAV